MDNYSKGFAVGITPTELEKGSGVSSKTIRRIINPYSDTGPSLESIDALASFFQIEAWELLRPRPATLQRIDPQPPPSPRALANNKGKAR
jgi:transcriptional regulator with XRE-family HTH domain